LLTRWRLRRRSDEPSHPGLGWAEVSARAGVPDRAFHQVFDSIEDCFLAAFDEGLGRLSATVADALAGKRDEGWLHDEGLLQRVRAGLVALLGFLDDEPRWGRLLLIEAPAAAEPERVRRVQGVLGELLDEARGEQLAGAAVARTPVAPAPELTRELVLGGVFAVIRERMLDRGRGPLVELAPSLMSFVVVSYLGHADASSALEGRSGSERPIGDHEGSSRGSEAPEVPVRATYRTALVLRAIASAPRSSNREIAQAAGLADEGQTSKLLSRLEDRGLIENVGLGAAHGEPNAWLLTPDGRHFVKAIGHGFALGAAVRSSRGVRRTA